MQLLLFKNHNFLIWFHTRNHNDILFIPLNLLLWNQQDWLRFLPFFYDLDNEHTPGVTGPVSSQGSHPVSFLRPLMLCFEFVFCCINFCEMVYRFLLLFFFYQLLCLKNAVPDVSTKHAKFDNSTIKSCKKGYDSKYAVIIKEFSQLI